MDVALQKYPEMVKEYFMTQCVPINDHKFVMLHAAVWSGGTFIYIPKNVKVDLPLQAYFRMNAERGGQFEHTLIIVDEGAEVQYIEGCSAPKYNKSSLHAGCVEIFVKPGARARYYSIENWSKNTYNLNTKRALVDEHGIMEWVSGNMGSGVTMLYPCSILRGAYARTDNLGLAFAYQGVSRGRCKSDSRGAVYQIHDSFKIYLCRRWYRYFPRTRPHYQKRQRGGYLPILRCPASRRRFQGGYLSDAQN